MSDIVIQNTIEYYYRCTEFSPRDTPFTWHYAHRQYRNTKHNGIDFCFSYKQRRPLAGTVIVLCAIEFQCDSLMMIMMNAFHIVIINSI